LRGVKLQLLLPAFISCVALLSLQEWKQLLESNLKVKHVLFIGGFLIGLIGLYLMRSGNFPALQVPDQERFLRDFLEKSLGVRPRFKEFLFGHPALILGLYLLGSNNGPKKFFRDGRFFICLGMIGQISIINTFFHFHSPLDAGILRTLHGCWLGILVSLPVCYFASRLGWTRPAGATLRVYA